MSVELQHQDYVSYFGGEMADLTNITPWYNKLIITTALKDSSTPWQTVQGGLEPEILGFESLSDEVAGLSSFRGLEAESAIRDLDVAQRGKEFLNAERLSCFSLRTTAERALTYLAYRGIKEDRGIGLVKASADRAIKKSTSLIHPAAEALDNAHSTLSLHGKKINFVNPEGTLTTGRVEAWGSLARLGKMGLGLSVVSNAGTSIIDVGHDQFVINS